MNQLLLIPVCEKHGCQKVWINDRSNRNGGFYRCRECNKEGSRRRNARNRANPEKTAQLNADARRRWAEQAPEQIKARGQQVWAQRQARFNADPAARRRHNDWQNANRAKKPLRDHRANNLKKTYGISHEDYDRMLEAQGGGCAICGATDSRTGRSDYLYVDHCHETGQVRGLLCGPCNSGIGYLGDSIDNLEAAIKYLNEAALGATTGRAA